MPEDMTVGELIAALEQFDDDTPVRFAYQPSYPFEAQVGPVEQVDIQPYLDNLGTETVVYLAVGAQDRYLPEIVSDQLKAAGWTEERF